MRAHAVQIGADGFGPHAIFLYYLLWLNLNKCQILAHGLSKAYNQICKIDKVSLKVLLPKLTYMGRLTLLEGDGMDGVERVFG